MTQVPESELEVANLLFKKYDLHKRDLHVHMQNFNTHVRRIQLAGAFAILAVTYLLFNKEYAPVDENKFVWLFFSVVIVTFSCYLLHDILYASFQIFHVAERMATIEEGINEALGESILFWESGLVAKLHETKFNPGLYAFAYGLLIFITLTIGLPIFLSFKVWPVVTTDAVLFKSLWVINLIYALGSAAWALTLVVRLLTKARREVRAVIDAFILQHKDLKLV